MKVHIFNRWEITKFTTDEPYIVISINDPGERIPLLDYDKNRFDLLSMYFHDVNDVYTAIKHDFKIFDFKDAKEIIDFVERYKDKLNTVVIHCHAGISRSAGVAAAILKIYNNDDRPVFECKQYIPNMRVYSEILKEALNRGLVG